MKILPEMMPEYKIKLSEQPPFSVKWEECMGWMIIPKIGEKLVWGSYDFPEKKCTDYTEIEVVGKAEIHGIMGVEIVAVQHDSYDIHQTGSKNNEERRFIAQLTDTHCRFLAECHMENGIRKCYTFLDDDIFLKNWGFGENNCGNETNLSMKGQIVRNGNVIQTANLQREVLDIVGRYMVKIGGKSYDTVCVMDVESYNEGVAVEQYLDKNGRTVLWRRFNRDDWKLQRYKQRWSEKLPNNERLIINGETYVHWYDCISDYIL